MTGPRERLAGALWAVGLVPAISCCSALSERLAGALWAVGLVPAISCCSALSERLVGVLPDSCR